MSSTARERWLFEVLRGADLLESHNSRYYRPKGQIKISTHKGQLTIREGDQFDVANPECIRVIRDGFAIRIPWMIVSAIKNKDTDSAEDVSIDPLEGEAPTKQAEAPSGPPSKFTSNGAGSRFGIIRGIGRLIASR
jgi:hypothetical protein